MRNWPFEVWNEPNLGFWGGGLSYLEGFLDFVEANDVPIDFVSSHGYENNVLAGPRGVADIFAPTRAVRPSQRTHLTVRSGHRRYEKS